MKSNQPFLPQPGNTTKGILLLIGSWFTSGPVLAGLIALILGLVLSFIIFFQQLEPGRASEIVIPTTPPSATMEEIQAEVEPSPTPRDTPTALPQPTRTLPPTPTASPVPSLPSSAMVEGLVGHRQSMPLSCEARSAVDWAAYFGIEIAEEDFFNGLSISDNPEEGFVGDVEGSWGQIPPEDYGVHARPIAQRLREYGLKAKSIRHMTLEELKGEIAAGKPVIIWVVGHVNRGTPVPYTSPSGETTTVAEFEHTVIVTGYTEHKVTVVDGARVYSIYQGEFLKSWDVLENQAVVWID